MIRQSLHAVVIVLSASLCIMTSVATEWNYDADGEHGPEHWQEAYPTCGNNRQSPVDLTSSSAEELATGVPLTFTGYDSPIDAMALINTGHAAQVNLPVGGSGAYVEGGGLRRRYRLQQFHFHWGERAGEGSEHLIDGNSHSLELHLVHYGDEYDDVTSAVESQNIDALAVVAIFVDEKSELQNVSEVITSITDLLDSVADEGTSVQLPALRLDSLLPGECQRQAIRYDGSLTTPGCDEVVAWTIFTQPIYATSQQLEKFRSTVRTVNNTVVTHNFRPQQLTHARPLFHYTGTFGVCAGADAILARRYDVTITSVLVGAVLTSVGVSMLH